MRMNDIIYITEPCDKEIIHPLDAKVYEMVLLAQKSDYELNSKFIKQIEWKYTNYAHDKFAVYKNVQIELPSQHTITIMFGHILGKLTYNCPHYGGVDNITINNINYHINRVNNTIVVFQYTNTNELTKINIELSDLAYYIDTVINDINKHMQVKLLTN